MFLKPFRIKSQTAIKGSDRKKLQQDICKQYGMLEETIKDLVPKKEDMTVMKVYTHAGYNVIVYIHNKNPIFFEHEKLLYPTVYTLWKYPDLLPSFATWPQVFVKLMNGADLMLPGVVLPRMQNITPSDLHNLEKGARCTIKLLGNKSPIAIGEAAMSSSDMYLAAMRGKCVRQLHCYKDYLWLAGDKSEPPVLEDEEFRSIDASDDKDTEEAAKGDADNDDGTERISDSEATEEQDPTKQNAPSDVKILGGNASELSEDLQGFTLDSSGLEACRGMSDEEDGSVTQEDMDELLIWCFKCALKLKVKKADLPMLTSNFYRNCILECCPKGKFLDIKKTSYKKLTKFLKEMQSREYLTIQEKIKGVEKIVSIDREHTELRAFKVNPCDLPEEGEVFNGEKQTKLGIDYQPPSVQEIWMVSGNTSEFFKLMGYSKGTFLSAQEIRDVLTKYIRENQLNNEGQVLLDIYLSNLLLNKGEYIETMTWEKLNERCRSKMSLAHQLTYPGQAPVIKKGKLEPICINVANRMGNKKVTLVDNLEWYGIDPAKFSHQVQVGVACSSSVNPTAGKKSLQVQVQGNQVTFISKLLIEKYGIQMKFILGMEKAPKQGKKKR